MNDRNTFYMFYGARENNQALCEQAVKSGADVNFPFNGRKGTKGSGGRWYYGDTTWYCPDGVEGNNGDTLLHIAMKTHNVELVDWLMSLANIDLACKNSSGIDPLQLATMPQCKDALKNVSFNSEADVVVNEAKCIARGESKAVVSPNQSAPNDNGDVSALEQYKDENENAQLRNANLVLKRQNNDLIAQIKALETRVNEGTNFLNEIAVRNERRIGYLTEEKL